MLEGDALIWLVDVLRPVLTMAVMSGINLAFSQEGALAVMNMERVIGELLKQPPGSKPDA